MHGSYNKLASYVDSTYSVVCLCLVFACDMRMCIGVSQVSGDFIAEVMIEHFYEKCITAVCG